MCSSSSVPDVIRKQSPISLASRARIERGDELLLVDVREPFENEIVRIEGARLIPLGSLESRLSEIADWRERSVVVHCHHGPRSRAACQILLANGFSRVENLAGGVDEWAVVVDPDLARY